MIELQKITKNSARTAVDEVSLIASGEIFGLLGHNKRARRHRHDAQSDGGFGGLCGTTSSAATRRCSSARFSRRRFFTIIWRLAGWKSSAATPPHWRRGCTVIEWVGPTRSDQRCTYSPECVRDWRWRRRCCRAGVAHSRRTGTDWIPRAFMMRNTIPLGRARAHDPAPRHLLNESSNSAAHRRVGRAESV